MTEARPMGLDADAGLAEDDRWGDWLESLFDPHVRLDAVRDGNGAVVDLRCSAVNRAACADFLAGRQALIGARALELIEGEAATALFERYLEVLRTGTPLALDDVELSVGPGTPRRRMDLRAVRADDGLTVSWRDVTQRWRERAALAEARSALAESEHRYRVIAELSSDFVYEIGPDMRIRWASPSIEALIGWSAEEIVGRTPMDLFPEEGRAESHALVAQSLSGVTIAGRRRLRRRDGTDRWFFRTARPVFAADGSVEAVVAGFRDIQSEVEADQARAASEERFRLLAENASDIVYLAAPDGSIQWVSPSVWEILGWAPEELIGRRTIEFVHPDDHGPLIASMSAVNRGQSVPIEFRLVRKDGTHRWFAGTSRPLHDRAGAVVARTGSMHDVTERHEAIEALERSEQRFRHTVDELLDPLVILRPVRGDDGHVTDFAYEYANPAACDFYGLALPDVVGHSIGELFPALIEDGWIDTYTRVLETGEPYRADGILTAGPAGDRYTDKRAYRVGSNLATTWRDVTTQRQAEAALREAETRYRLLLHSAADVVVLTDPDAVVTWVSASVRTILGYEPEELMGLPLLELVHPDDRDAWVRRRMDLDATGSASYEARYRQADGGYRWISVATTVVRDVQGAIVARTGILRDIAAEHAARVALEASREALRELNEGLEQRVRERTEELETFTYTLSHDLRAPLRWINGFAAMLQRRDGDRLDETSRHYLDEIRNASDRMGRLFEELLDYSRLGRQTVRAERIAWATLTAGIRGTFAPRMAASGATLEIEEPLAPVVGDPMLLDRAIANLVDNALTYTRDGQPAHVTLRAVPVGERIRVSVSDEGIGIPADQRERIFQPFVRLHDAEAYPGTGIGLAIVHRAVGLMGSEIRLDSAVGAGTTFWFELPSA